MRIVTAEDERPVLVTGATGRQGGAVSRALVARGIPIRVLVRDRGAAAAGALAALTDDVAVGDLDDKDSLLAACTGARAVFSMQAPVAGNPHADVDRGRRLAAAATEAGVPQFVHSSTSGAGKYHRNAPGWAEQRWNATFWDNKAAMEDVVRRAGFRHWTLIKPAYFMEHEIFQVGHLSDPRIVSAIAADTVLPLVAVQDIGEAVAAAVTDPETFDRAEVELAGDVLTPGEIADVLSREWVLPIRAECLTPAEAVAHGLHPAVVNGQVWCNVVGQPARPDTARRFGLQPRSLATWAREHQPD